MTVQRWATLAIVTAVLAGADAASPNSYGALVSGKPQIVVQGPLPRSDAVFAWSDDGGLLASVSVEGRVLQVWDTATGNLINSLPLPFGSGYSLYSANVGFSSDNRWVSLRAEPYGSSFECLFFHVSLTGANPQMARSDKPVNCAQRSDPRPPSKDGRRIVKTPSGGEMITPPFGFPQLLAGGAARQFVNVAISGDGSAAVLLENTKGSMVDAVTASTAEVWALRTGTRTSRLRLVGNYRSAAWLGNGRYALIGAEGGGIGAPPTLIVDGATTRTVDRVAPRCLTTPYGVDGAMLGGRERFCIEYDEIRKGVSTPGLWVRSAGAAWRPARAAGLGAPVVETLATTPDRRRTVIGTRRIIHYQHPGAADPGALIQDQTRIVLVDGDLLGTTATARELPVRFTSGNERVTDLRLTADGQRVVIQTDQRLITYDLASAQQKTVKGGSATEVALLAADRKSAIAARSRINRSDILDLNRGERTGAVFSDGAAIAAGFIDGGHVLWTATADGSLYFADRGVPGPPLVMQLLGPAGDVAFGRSWHDRVFEVTGPPTYITYDDQSRYDNPMGPDGNTFRWVFPDQPLRSLAGQTFMRDYLEPQLYSKWLACVAAKDCDVSLPPPANVADLNRNLPFVSIRKVVAGPAANTATVDVEVTSTEARMAWIAKQKKLRHLKSFEARSGVYDLRLFRDGKLVGQWPPVVQQKRVSSIGASDDWSNGSVIHLARNPSRKTDRSELLPYWRKANAVPADRDGIIRHSFTVRLPTGWRQRDATFTAYAFNEDRVKSDTARQTYTRPWTWPARPKAYILTIGIDAYKQPGLSLSYAGADADLLAGRLADVPGYSVRELRLRGKAGHAAATRVAIADAISLLAPGDHAAARARLKALGVDASAFAAATPDDLVIISYAGHGWADDRGNFFLIPSDARFLDAFDTMDGTDGRREGDPDTATLISAAALTDWLRPIDAGEAAIIIDACQSAASVAAQGFKPGPMGDRGLGQLAYDKGIRILVASRGDEKAREDAALGHGLLTAALGLDGLDGRGFGRADINGDGRITLDEWLRYAVTRLPALGGEVAHGDGRGLRRRQTAVASLAALPADAIQQPSLFDFTGTPSSVVLGTEPLKAQIQRWRASVENWTSDTVAATGRAKAVFTQTLYPEVVALALAVLALLWWIVRGVWRRVARWRGAVDTPRA